MKPLCKFCHGHHDPGEEHPEEAVREALAKLREGKKPEESGFAVGRRTIAEVREHVEAVTKLPPERDETPEPVTKLPAASPSVTKGRPRRYASRAEQQRAYRERKG